MHKPNPDKINEWLTFAGRQLRNVDFHRDDAPARADVARAWLDMARFQHERLRDYEATQHEESAR